MQNISITTVFCRMPDVPVREGSRSCTQAHWLEVL